MYIHGSAVSIASINGYINQQICGFKWISYYLMMIQWLSNSSMYFWDTCWCMIHPTGIEPSILWGEIMGFNRFNPPQVGTYVFSRSSRNCLFSIGLLETVLGKMHCGFTISIPITENRCRIFLTKIPWKKYLKNRILLTSCNRTLRLW